MKTLLLSERDIDIAADIIKRGGIVAVPTETVYGLAADALNGKAVEKIFKAKGRPMDNPLIVHIADIEDVYGLVSEFPEKAKILAEKFWPGPLTVILPKSNIIPNEVSAGLDTVAVRFPSNKIAQRLIKSSVPLAAPSANLSGSPSPTNAKHVMDDMNGRIDAVIDGGESDVGLESTVITLAENPPRLLRPGGITLEQLRDTIGEVIVDDAVLHSLKEGQTASSPGMKYKHYSPKADVVLLKGSQKAFTDYVNNHGNEKTAALCYDGDVERLRVSTISIGDINDRKTQAHKLFAALRNADDQGFERLYAHCPVADGIGLAIYNRIIRAAGFEVIELDE